MSALARMFTNALRYLPISCFTVAYICALAFAATADPLSDCRELAAQMLSNSTNEGLASNVVVAWYKEQIKSLASQLAVVTKERDELKAKGPSPGG
jgi:hypothetical protein